MMPMGHALIFCKLFSFNSTLPYAKLKFVVTKGKCVAVSRGSPEESLRLCELHEKVVRLILAESSSYQDVISSYSHLHTRLGADAYELAARITTSWRFSRTDEQVGVMLGEIFPRSSQLVCAIPHSRVLWD